MRLAALMRPVLATATAILCTMSCHMHSDLKRRLQQAAELLGRHCTIISRATSHELLATMHGERVMRTDRIFCRQWARCRDPCEHARARRIRLRAITVISTSARLLRIAGEVGHSKRLIGRLSAELITAHCRRSTCAA
jgi:hypothetical protein